MEDGGDVRESVTGLLDHLPIPGNPDPSTHFISDLNAVCIDIAVCKGLIAVHVHETFGFEDEEEFGNVDLAYVNFLAEVKDASVFWNIFPVSAMTNPECEVGEDPCLTDLHLSL